MHNDEKVLEETKHLLKLLGSDARFKWPGHATVRVAEDESQLIANGLSFGYRHGQYFAVVAKGGAIKARLAPHSVGRPWIDVPVRLNEEGFFQAFLSVLDANRRRTFRVTDDGETLAFDEYADRTFAHAFCGGMMERRSVSDELDALFCRSCMLRLTLPKDLITAGQVSHHFNKTRCALTPDELRLAQRCAEIEGDDGSPITGHPRKK